MFPSSPTIPAGAVPPTPTRVAPDVAAGNQPIVRSDEKQQTLVFLTNHFGLGASTVAAIYKERWQIELFFKALKQNLKIKTFVETSANAVKIQVWTALIAILILRYLQLKSKFS